MKDKKIFLKGLICGFAAAAAVGMVLSNLIGNGIAISDIKKLGEINRLLSVKYVDEYDKTELLENMYKGYVSGIGDKYTSYMSKEELTELLETTNGTFYGVGIIVTSNSSGQTVVVSVIKDTPAYEAGIESGDILVEVDGEEVSGKSLSEVTAMIKGKTGTKVNLTFIKYSGGKIYSCDVERKQIDMPSVYHEKINNDIGYIQITQFAENTDLQFEEALSELQESGIKSLILDLRNNLGGRFDTVQKITDMLVPEGIMVYTIDKEGNREDSFSDESCLNIPLCILVNEYTASASEVLSGAVQDMGMGVLVGTKTFGKGLVQGLYTMKDGSGLKITIQKYYTPKGVCIHGEGLMPDYEVYLPDEYESFSVIPREDDTQLEKAIEILS